MGSTLTHVRYYLDDPVHLLVSCAELQKCDCNFVHQEAKALFSVEDVTEIFTEEEDMAAENNNNANNARKVLGDFTAPTPDFYGRSISIPAIGANNFELKPGARNCNHTFATPHN